MTRMTPHSPFRSPATSWDPLAFPGPAKTLSLTSAGTVLIADRRHGYNDPLISRMAALERIAEGRHRSQRYLAELVHKSLHHVVGQLRAGFPATGKFGSVASTSHTVRSVSVPGTSRTSRIAAE
jgi:hypothetical protein